MGWIVSLWNHLLSRMDMTAWSKDCHDALYPQSAATGVAKSKMCTEVLGKACPIPRRATLQEDGSDFFIATGINHNATGAALYSSISMYNFARLESIGMFTSIPAELDPSSYVGSVYPIFP